MKKLFAILLAVAMVSALLTGCRSNREDPNGEGVVGEVTEDIKDSVTGDNTDNNNDNNNNSKKVKTGLGVAADLGGSRSAGEEAGLAQYEIVMAAVTVDDEGVITNCVLDSISTSLDFDKTGAITSDITVAPQTNREQDNGWQDEANKLAESVIGKKADELNNSDKAQNAADTGNTDKQNTDSGNEAQNGNASENETAGNETPNETASGNPQTSASLNMEHYNKAIAKAVQNATHLGAQEGDELRLATIPSWNKSAAATGEGEGAAQLDLTMTALTTQGDTITSCVIDGLQATVNFDQTGKVSTDLTADLQTKNELGEAYGLKEYGGSKYEWNEQAAFFAEYVTGKTAEEVQNIAVDETGVPTDADLNSTVTIKVGEFMKLIEKAAS